jgi:predicted Zn-dependent protease
LTIVVNMLAAVALACAARAGAAIEKAAPPPPYAGVYQPIGVDEIGIWKEADEDERVLANSPIVIRDAALNTYVRKALCDTVGSNRCGSARIYLLRVPVFNASMTPNGTMRVFSGLLLRVQSEAELGAILGHEFGHFEQRHSLAHFKARRAGTDVLSWAGVLTAMAHDANARASFNDLRLSVYGNLFRFSRDQEREADRFGIGYLNTSTLRPQAAAVVWRNAIAEAEASSVARGLRKSQLDRVAFYASHPPEAERAQTLTLLAAADAAGRDDGAAGYALALRPWLPLFLDDQIKLNDFGASAYLIETLAQHGWTADLCVARGDLYRARGNPRDLVNAAEFYAQAAALDPDSAEAQRGLGFAMLKTGRRAEGQVALRRYLTLAPEALDATMIAVLAGSSGDQ